MLKATLPGDLNGANPSMSRTLTLDSYQRVTKIDTTQAGVFLQRDTLSYNQVDQITSRGWISANNAAENQHLENATYDKVGRITQASIAGGTTTAVTYNDAGDITSKTGVGNYSYTLGTHRLAAIVGSAGGVTNPSYTYDANGNMLTGAGISATWTSFNMVASISRYGATDSFHYGPDNERIVQESPTTLTLYSLSSGFELEAPYSASNCKKQDMSGCVWEARIYVQAEGKARALLIDRANNTRAWRYLHHDHLGSVTLVTDHTGAVQARYGFDAWGARRNANGTAQTGTIAPEVDRGYTDSCT
jgi:YD repeat-containing protein